MRHVLWAVVALAATTAAMLSPAGVPAQENAAPELVYQYPDESAAVSEPLFFIQLCFEDSINIRDLRDGGDFAFSVTAPDGFGLGLRTVFQPDAHGAAIYPGDAPGETVGEWTFTWRVTSPDGMQASEGEIKYTVGPEGEPPPKETPAPCPGAEGTPQPTVEGATPTSTAIQGSSDDGNDDTIYLWVAAIAAVLAAAVGLFAWRFRRSSAGPQAPSG